MIQRESRPLGAAPKVTGEDDSTSVAQAADRIPEPRWCRFAAIWCRCSVEPPETATMHACAAHYLHEVVGADG